MKKQFLTELMAFLFCCVIFRGVSFARDDYCCSYYSPENPFSCTTHDKAGHEGDHGNCPWWTAFKMPVVGKTCAGKNASDWFETAKTAVFPTGQTAEVGAIAVFNIANSSYGHVAYVEKVYDDGKFDVTEMGWNTWDCVHDGPKYDKDHFGKNNLIGFIYQVGNYADGWQREKGSKAIAEAYIIHGGVKTFGKTWSNGNGGVFVHSWPDNANDPDAIDLQDFLNGDHWWVLEYNKVAKKAFPVYGRILDRQIKGHTQIRWRK